MGKYYEVTQVFDSKYGVEPRLIKFEVNEKHLDRYESRLEKNNIRSISLKSMNPGMITFIVLSVIGSNVFSEDDFIIKLKSLWKGGFEALLV